MQNVTEEEKRTGLNYVTYRGLGFTPMIGGVPLFSALIMMGIGVLALVMIIAGAPLISIFLIVCDIIIFVFLKVICENNNKAPKLFALKAKGFMGDLKSGKIKVADSGANANEQKERYNQKFKLLFVN